MSDAYDDLYGDFPPCDEQTELLARLSGVGTAVEMGSGTGRSAIPLAERGVRVIGVDASEGMTRTLRSKGRGLPIEAVCADAANFKLDEEVALVFATFNTFFLLAHEETQQGFMESAASVLQPGGSLVVETFVPRAGLLPDGPNPGVLPEESDVVVKQWAADQVVLFAARNTASANRFDYHEIVLRDGEPVRLHPGRMRYLWPNEIDAMASSAGLSLSHRWSNWDRSPYSADTSRKHVSVYTK
ncbi:methyltransferase domain-containing protein [Streptomyces sp. SID4928]|nr:methyltransferase domain-containing protein [Streptomyces sp. SID4928]